MIDSPIKDSLPLKERTEIPGQIMSNDQKMDEHVLNQIEILIQQQFQIFVPILVFEYRPFNGSSKEFSRWDYDDLYEFFTHFGEIELLEIQGKLSFILFKTFFDAYTSRDFLLNSSNYKETERNNFMVRWYMPEDEHHISEIMRLKIKKYTPSQVIENINMSMNSMMNGTSSNLTQSGLNQSNYSNFYNYGNPYTPNPYNEYFPTNVNAQYGYYANFVLSPGAKNEFNQVLNSESTHGGHRNYQGGYNYEGNEDNKSTATDKGLNNGKYTCKFEILIENENEFQVARRLIGAKVIKIN
jgi:hypothetical protein